VNIEPEYSNRASRRDATACAALPRTSRGSPAQAFSVTEDESDTDDPDDDLEENDGEEEYDEENSEPQALPPTAPQYSNGRGATATACADSPVQPTPRNAVRGHNPQSRSVSDHTACAATDSNHASRRDGTACVASPTQAVPTSPFDPRHRGRDETATACADSPAQPTPRNEFAVIIRKAGRSPIAPLAQTHPRKTLRTPRRNPALRSIRIRLRAAKVPLAPPHPRNPRRTRMPGKIHLGRQRR